MVPPCKSFQVLVNVIVFSVKFAFSRRNFQPQIPEKNMPPAGTLQLKFSIGTPQQEQVSTSIYNKISTHTVDGCEILHQLIDGKHPISYRRSTILLVDFATIHRISTIEFFISHGNLDGATHPTPASNSQSHD